MELEETGPAWETVLLGAQDCKTCLLLLWADTSAHSIGRFNSSSLGMGQSCFKPGAGATVSTMTSTFCEGEMLEQTFCQGLFQLHIVQHFLSNKIMVWRVRSTKDRRKATVAFTIYKSSMSTGCSFLDNFFSKMFSYFSFEIVIESYHFSLLFAPSKSSHIPLFALF